MYIRANFNRGGLGPLENILMVVNYAASNYYQADQTPTDCFTNYNGVNLYNTLPNPLSNFDRGPGPLVLGRSKPYARSLLGFRMESFPASRCDRRRGATVHPFRTAGLFLRRG